jgi:hypothetical protein
MPRPKKKSLFGDDGDEGKHSWTASKEAAAALSVFDMFEAAAATGTAPTQAARSPSGGGGGVTASMFVGARPVPKDLLPAPAAAAAAAAGPGFTPVHAASGAATGSPDLLSFGPTSQPRQGPQQASAVLPRLPAVSPPQSGGTTGGGGGSLEASLSPLARRARSLLMQQSFAGPEK